MQRSEVADFQRDPPRKHFLHPVSLAEVRHAEIVHAHQSIGLIISHSRDCARLAELAARLGYVACRGSSSRGGVGALPPGEGGFNPGGFMYMWHSHNEKEIINNNIFPGGMLTMVLVMP